MANKSIELTSSVYYWNWTVTLLCFGLKCRVTFLNWFLLPKSYPLLMFKLPSSWTKTLVWTLKNICNSYCVDQCHIHQNQSHIYSVLKWLKRQKTVQMSPKWESKWPPDEDIRVTLLLQWFTVSLEFSSSLSVFYGHIFEARAGHFGVIWAYTIFCW